MCFYPVIERPLNAPMTIENSLAEKYREKKRVDKLLRHGPFLEKKKPQSRCNLLKGPDALRAAPASRVVL
jgi:hypothetical protein